MSNHHRAVLLTLLVSPWLGSGCTEAAQPPLAVDQGQNWGRTSAEAFYTTQQGSQMIPLAWITVLKHPDGTSFLADGLARYGYLQNTYATKPTYPVGFVTSTDATGTYLGMTCAACHTRQLTYNNVEYRVDGGPALADFGQFLLDLDAAMGAVVPPAPGFSAFATAVLGAGATQAQIAALGTNVTVWYQSYHLIMSGVPHDPTWGVGRLDAVTMIFNRVTGLDIGPAVQNYLIAGNIAPATAPARYPFLWNAAIQDRTQWPGFAANGSSILGLARNLGEVMGVFARFHPKANGGPLFGIDYLANGASADFDGLNTLESLIRQIGAPAWPAAWPLDQQRAAQGRAVYVSAGCANCHWLNPVVPGVERPLFKQTWCTPILNVSTDGAELKVLDNVVDTGVLNGASIPLVTQPLKPRDKAFNVLSLAVTGSILDHYAPVSRLLLTNGDKTPDALTRAVFDQDRLALETAFKKPGAAAAPAESGATPRQHCGTDPNPLPAGYESRVLFGIWAAAPYLHNGSVPTLADLLRPASDRPASFKTGTAYDPVRVGLAADQPGVSTTLTTTGCEAADSGNSRCGHEFGTTLSDGDKAALLEFLKTL